MRKLLILCLCLTASAFAQISGAGQLGCNGAPVTGTAWTSATSNNTTQILGTNVTGAQVLITLDQTTTLTVGAVTFQGDPGDGTFVTLFSWQIVDPTTAPFGTVANPYTLQASTNKQFLVLMGGMSRLQLKLTTAITGTGSITPFTTLVCYQLPLAFQNTNTNLNVSATFPSPQSVTQSGGPWTENITQFAGLNLGATAVVNYGSTPAGVAVPAVNAFVTNVNANGQAVMASSAPVVIASNQSAIAAAGQGATGSAVPTGSTYIGANGSGNLTGIIACDNSSAVNMVTATTTQIVAISGTAGRTYICSINLVAAGADNVALVSGSGSNCASNLAGLAGGTTAATGWNFAANGGLTQGNGLGMIFKTATTNNEICLVTSAAVQLSGTITWTQF